MDDIKETLWKNSLFSDYKDSNVEIDKETDDITEKMKKFNKRKRYKENFKNIEELRNIYDVKENFKESKKKKKIEKENFTETDEKKEIKEKKETDEKKDKTKNKVKREGFSSGLESPKKPEKSSDNDFMTYLYVWISYLIENCYFYTMYIYVIFNYSIYNFCYNLTKQYSYNDINSGNSGKILNLDVSNKGLVDDISSEFGPGKKSSENDDADYENQNYNETQIENDATILSEIIISIIIFPILVIMTYNWFYLICYYDENSSECIDKECPENNIKFICCRPAHDFFRTPLTWGTEYMVNFFLDFLLVPLSIIDKLILGTKVNFFNPIDAYKKEEYSKYDLAFTLPCLIFLIDNFLKSINLPSKILQKFVMGILSFFILYKMSLFSSINSVIKNENSFPLILCYIIAGIYFVYTSVRFLFMDLRDIFFGDPTNGKDPLVKSPGPVILVLSILLACIIYFFSRLIIFLLSLKISFLILIIYFWFHSLFGIFWYKITKGDDKIPITFEDKLMDMNMFINSDINFLKKNTECKESNVLMNIFKFIIYSLLNNFFVIFFISLLSINITSCYNIESINIQLGTIYFLSFLIILCLFKIFFFTSYS